jgi:4-hydroxybutyryl-CoA dehydratase / vinylacetyl-CoA-Delta-isomerase
VENPTLGPGAVTYLIESLHGAGLPPAQDIMVRRLSGLEKKIQLAKKLSRIEDKPIQ